MSDIEEKRKVCHVVTAAFAIFTVSSTPSIIATSPLRPFYVKTRAMYKVARKKIAVKYEAQNSELESLRHKLV